MANIINLPTYEQVEEVKTTMAEGLGTDWSKYTPMRLPLGVNLNTTGTRKSTIYSVAGEGYIKKFVLTESHALKVNAEIWVDGSLKSTISLENNSNAAGIAGDESIMLNNAAPNIFVPTTGLKNITATFPSSLASISNGIFIISAPIFFKKSLEIKVLIPETVTSGGTNIYYDLVGGVAL